MQAWEPKLCKHGGEPGWDRSCLQPAFTAGEEEEKGERTVSLLSLSLWDTGFPELESNQRGKHYRSSSDASTDQRLPQCLHCSREISKAVAKRGCFFHKLSKNAFAWLN